MNRMEVRPRVFIEEHADDYSMESRYFGHTADDDGIVWTR